MAVDRLVKQPADATNAKNGLDAMRQQAQMKKAFKTRSKAFVYRQTVALGRVPVQGSQTRTVKDRVHGKLWYFAERIGTKDWK